jgi:hypothetical protein
MESEILVLVYRRVQKEGEEWDWGLWAIFGKKAQYFFMKVCYSFSG